MGEWCAENLRSLADWRAEGFLFSTASDQAVKMYDALARQVTSLRECEQLGGFSGTMVKLFEADPEAIMPRVAKGVLESMISTPSADTLKAIEAIQKDAEDHGTDWEKLHVKALAQLGQRNLASAVQIWDDILDIYPTDLLTVKLATDGYFWLGDGQSIRRICEGFMPKWKSSLPCYSFLHGMYAFGLEETGSHMEGINEAKKALSLNKFDGWATHAKIHGLEMIHHFDEGIRFLEETLDDWVGGFLQTHTFWHKGLFYIEKGDFEAALSLFDSHIAKNLEVSKALMSAVDATALLLRLEMEGVDVGSRWKDLPSMAVHAEEHALPFSDCHLAPFYLRRGEDDLEQKTHDSLINRTRSPQNELDKVNEVVGLSVFEGMEDYIHGKYGQAVEKIYPVRKEIHRIGGSNAQRDLFTQVLINSCIQSDREGHKDLVKNLMEERASIRFGTSSVAERIALRFQEKHPL